MVCPGLAAQLKPSLEPAYGPDDGVGDQPWDGDISQNAVIQELQTGGGIHAAYEDTGAPIEPIKRYPALHRGSIRLADQIDQAEPLPQGGRLPDLFDVGLAVAVESFLPSPEADHPGNISSQKEPSKDKKDC